jgi:hypothetical protein
VPRVEADWQSDEKLSDDRLGEPSSAIRARVEAARERQRQRFAGTGLMSNADAPASEGVDRRRCGTIAGWTTSLLMVGVGKNLLCSPSEPAAMQQHAEGTRVSARAYDELLWSSPHPETGADDGPKTRAGPGGEREDRDAAPGGGDSVPAEKADVTCTWQSEH